MPVPVRVSSARPRRLDLFAVMSLAGASALVAMATAFAFPDGAAQWVLFAHGSITYATVGAVILSRRPGHRLGRLTLGVGLAFSVATILTSIFRAIDPTVTPGSIGPVEVVLGIAVVLASALPAFGLLFGATLMIVWFPDGRRTSRLGGLVELLVVVGVVAAFVSALSEPAVAILGESADLRRVFDVAAQTVIQVFAVGFVVSLLDLILRYRRADGLRRVQMRWVLASVAVTAGVTVANFAFADSVEWLWIVWLGSTTLPIIGVAIAITRYHLYDIDRVISRSISYVVVSGILFALVGGTILVLQQAIGGAVARPGEELEPALVAILTLVVAALFSPLRSRVQRSVDRRFHRARYDAERTVGGFAGRLRDNLDLPTLTSELQRTTVEAVEPTATGIWLRTSAASS